MKGKRPTDSASPPVSFRAVIVDDHQMMCEGLRVLLESIPGLTVAGTCGDCATARHLASALQPDLMLVDIQLADGDGLELTRSLRAERPALRILVMTAQPDRRLAAAASAAGAAGFVVKTATKGEWFAAIRTILADPAARGDHPSVRSPANVPPPPIPAPPGTARNLPAREAQVLHFLLRGLRNKEIAAELGLSIKTVETYRSRLMQRFQCRSTPELVRQVIREGLVQP